MKRRGLIKFQIFLLVVLAIVVIIRVVKGPPAPDGLVVFVDLDAQDLRYASFELGARTDLAIEAVGSFDDEAMPLGFAAHGWVVRHEDREVVWKMDPASVERGRGSLAHVRGDTFALDAGRYDVYFASYGQAESHRRRPHWRSEADRWQFVLNTVDETASARLIPGQRLSDIEPAPDNRVWWTSQLGNSEERERLFEVKQPTQLRIYAVGEIDDEPQDYAWIEDADTGNRIWGFSRDNTEPAGGATSNRKYRGTLNLDPGAYRVVAKTNRRHAYNRWEHNPPYDPASWGLTLHASDASVIGEFDPWTSRQPIASFTRVPDNAELSQRFEVTQPINVVVYSLGEMTDRHNIYDYGELLKEEPDRKQTIWKMTWDGSGKAGGDSKNRLEVAFLSLQPGIYDFRYESDGSHSFAEFNASRPDYPERWGATLFPMAVALDSGAVQLLASPTGTTWTNPHGPPTPPGPVTHVGDPIVSWTRVRGEFEQTHTFTLDTETKLHVVALGEISSGNQYDYGWIERADNGRIVWEMTRDNTMAAGGGESNRRFDGLIALEAGEYRVHFISDSSHHYGTFGDDTPATPEEWGITIYRVAAEESGAAVEATLEAEAAATAVEAAAEASGEN